MLPLDKLRADLSSFAQRSNHELLRICSDALDAGLFEELEIWLTRFVTGTEKDNFRAWQMLGLARRELGDSGGAFQAFQRARQLAPNDAKIAHSLARTALEAGFPSKQLFTQAKALTPNDS